MSKRDWFVLCLLVTAREHGFRHAYHLCKRACREEPMYVIAAGDWVVQHLRHLHMEFFQDGTLVLDEQGYLGGYRMDGTFKRV